MSFRTRTSCASRSFGGPFCAPREGRTDGLAGVAFFPNPSALGRFAPVLQQALAKGDKSFAASTYVLGQTDPEFQALTQKLNESEN